MLQLNKMRLYIAVLAFLMLAGTASSQPDAPEAVKHEIRHQQMDRSYWLYIPENLSAHAPLVFVLHGYGAKAEGYRPEMMKVAREHGFAVCYPQGAKDARDKNCWNVGYPFQKGLKTDDIDFICGLSRHLQKTYGFDRNNIFLSGMSNGGELCYQMAAIKPDAFAAYAPIAGLTMTWSYKKHRSLRPVPLMEVHGTMDMTSKWEGDPANEGGWGEYISVPVAVGLWASSARCTHEQVIELPQIRNKVILHRFLGGDPAWEGGPPVEVRLYEIVGGKHSWGLSDMDTCEEIWKFFSMYLR